jgi:hypothetical protein
MVTRRALVQSAAVQFASMRPICAAPQQNRLDVKVLLFDVFGAFMAPISKIDTLPIGWRTALTASRGI